MFIHPKSVNFQVNSFDSPFLVYHEKVKTSKVSISSSEFSFPLILQESVSKKLPLQKPTFGGRIPGIVCKSAKYDWLIVAMDN